MDWSAANSGPKAGISTGKAPTAWMAAWTYLSPTLWTHLPWPFSLRQAVTPTSGRKVEQFIPYHVENSDFYNRERPSSWQLLAS
jgi:hypothetical protein